MPRDQVTDIEVEDRVGIDLVDAAEIRDALALHGERYLQRVYTAQEVQDCRGADDRVDPDRLAARFAAKEAVIKILRPGRDTAVPWTGIAVRRAADGWVGVALSGAAADLAASAGVTRVALSLSHERGLSCAVALAHLEPPTRRTP